MSKDLTNLEKIDHPVHYNIGREVIDFIEKHNLNFCVGNAIKYLCRAPYKNNLLEDLDKALWYLKRESTTHSQLCCIPSIHSQIEEKQIYNDFFNFADSWKFDKEIHEVFYNITVYCCEKQYYYLDNAIKIIESILEKK